MFRKRALAGVLGLALAGSFVAVETADARRGGGFGSRGARTYSAPPPTQTAPSAAQPIQRSMTTPTPGQTAAQRPGAQAQQPGMQPQRRGGFLGGLGGGILGGLLVGGLIGALLGNGFGAGAGAILATIVQVAVIALIAMLLLRLFRRRQQPAAASAGAAPGAAGWPSYANRDAQPSFGQTAGFGQGGSVGQPYAPVTPTHDILVTGDDREAFERLLTEVQDAFAREDYGSLRAITTPEVMSYLAEELSENATRGRRNEVSGTRLLEADVAEAWREGDREYATAALRYESIDVIRDRQTGAVIEGDASRPTQTTELWTFVRERGEAWKLSAIQDAA